MSGPATFADLGKSAKDFFTKDHPVEKSKVEVTTNAANGATFVSSVTRDSKGVLVGLLNPKFKYNRYGLNLNTSIDTTQTWKVEASVQDQVTKGLKNTVVVQSGKVPLKLTTEFKNQRASVTSTIEPLSHETTTAVVLSHEGFLLGGEVQANPSSGDSPVKQLSVTLGYKNAEFEALTFARQKPGSLVCGASYFHTVSPSLSFASEFTSEKTQKDDSDTTTNKLVLGSLYKLDDQTTVKAKVDATGAVGVSYIHQLTKATKVVLGATVNTNSLLGSSAEGHKIGLELLINN